jgi:hypothetical protein
MSFFTRVRRGTLLPRRVFVRLYGLFPLLTALSILDVDARGRQFV